MAKTTEERVGIVETEVDNLKDSDRGLWEHMNGLERALQKLVPVWTTIILTIMGGITGSALTFAGMVIKLAK